MAQQGGNPTSDVDPIPMDWFMFVTIACICLVNAALWIFCRRVPAKSRQPGSGDTESINRNKTRQLNTQLSQSSNRNKELQHVISRLRNELDQLNREKQDEISNLHAENENMSTQMIKLQRQLQRLKSDYDWLKTNHQKVKESLKSVEHDKEVALKRLSKVVGDRLVQNNPNIADLNDPYRPTKLADINNELYDNEWTSAFASLNEKRYTDNECIEILLHIVLQVHFYCQSHINGGIHALFSEDKEAVSTIKEALKTKSDRMIPNKYKEFYSGFCAELDRAWPGIHNLKDLQIYIENCFSLCWYMAIQDPPVVFQYTPGSGSVAQIPRGTKFSRDLYREYTKRGPYLDFIVWPMLLLHADGPLLCKGVAEGLKA